ncbi:MAG TPA: SBBP repeat-containing protein [Kofleriaceae bacterium]|nr:SBBP repeat-containing protein [Kofleriaceae bacterium]
MRPSWLVVAVALGSCSKGEEPRKAPPVATSVAPAQKLPVPTTPLPALAADPGGATGKALWSTAFGGLGVDGPRGVAVGPGGEVYVAGYFEGTSDFGGTIGKRPSAGASDAFVTKLDPNGKLQWAQTFGSKREDVANAIAVRGDKIVVVGSFCDELKLDEWDHKAIGSDDLYAIELDDKGNVIWVWTLGGVDSDGANAVAATPDGGWVIGGSFSDSIDLANVTLKSKGRTDALLVKLKASGDLEWAKQFGGRYDDTILHLAVDGNGNIYVQGHFQDVSDWGGKPLTAAGGSDNDVVLAKYDPNGEHLWSQRFGNAFNDVAGGVAVDLAGNVTMVGSFDKSVSFGEGDTHTSLGEADAYVVRFTTDGKLEWARTFGAEREDVAWGVAADDAGNTVTTGWFQNSVDFGKGGAITSKGNKDVFALKLDAHGAPVWVQTWGDHDHDQGRGVALDAKGNAIVVGIFRFTLAIADPPLQSKIDESDPVRSKAPPPDVFVVKLAR